MIDWPKIITAVVARSTKYVPSGTHTFIYGFNITNDHISLIYFLYKLLRRCTYYMYHALTPSRPCFWLLVSVSGCRLVVKCCQLSICCLFVVWTFVFYVLWVDTGLKCCELSNGVHTMVHVYTGCTVSHVDMLWLTELETHSPTP